MPTKGESRSTPATANRFVAEPLKIVKSPINPPIAPRPSKMNVTKATIISDDENEDKAPHMDIVVPQKSIPTPQKASAVNQKVVLVSQKSNFAPQKFASASRQTTQTPQIVVDVSEKAFSHSPVKTILPQQATRTPQKVVQKKMVSTPQKFDSAPEETFTIEEIVPVTEDDFSNSPIITSDPFDSPFGNIMETSIPSIEDINPTLDNDLDFNWDDFLQPSTPLLRPDLPVSLGSPDSGFGSEIIGSDITSTEEYISDYPFGDDMFLDSLISENDPNLVTLPSNPECMEFDADKFLSDFLSF